MLAEQTTLLAIHTFSSQERICKAQPKGFSANCKMWAEPFVLIVDPDELNPFMKLKEWFSGQVVCAMITKNIQAT